MCRDDVKPRERFLGKTVVLGAGYGTGWLTFQKQLKLKGVTVTDDTAQSIIHTYREAYPRIPLLWREAGKALDADGIKALAAIPSREVLIAQVAGLLKSPIQRLAGVLAALAEKRGGGAEAATDAAAEAAAPAA